MMVTIVPILICAPKLAYVTAVDGAPWSLQLGELATSFSQGGHFLSCYFHNHLYSGSYLSSTKHERWNLDVWIFFRLHVQRTKVITL
jgi:hypothetical protein